ncbi:MAG: hypothetical protein MUO57_11010 [Anaerolineales bacterium]|nr:hypothetical protein [Anaerolineales bacterium]
MDTVRNTFLILLILILVFGSFFLLERQDQVSKVQTTPPSTRYSTSVAWLEVCAVYSSEPLGILYEV